MAINRDFSSIGGDLEGTLADLRMVPDQVLASYSQNATPLAKGNVTLGLAVTSELARRKGIRQEQAAKENPDPQGLPTVLQGLLSGQMSGPGGTPAPAAGISAFSQQPQQAQQSQQPQQIVLNQPKTATAPTLATPYSAPKLPTPPSQPTRKMAQGGIVAFNGEDESYVERTNREAHERGVREPDPELAAIRDIKERDKRRLEKYGPPREPVLEGLASIGAGAKDALSYPVRAIAAAANKYLPIPDIPESFFGGDRSSMTPYLDQLRRSREATRSTQPSSDTTATPSPTPASTPATAAPSAPAAAPVPTSDPRVLSSLSASQRVSTSGPASERQAPASMQGLPTLQELYQLATTPGPRRGEFQTALANYQKYMQDLKPVALDEAERNRITGEKFKEFQAVSDPYYAKMQRLLDEERKTASQGTPGADSLIRFGFGLMGHRGNLASGIGQSGLAALNYFDQAKKAEAEAIREARKGEMALIRSRMADERGDRTAAQAELNKYQQAKEKEQQAEIDKQKLLLGASEKSASEEDKGRRDTVDVMSRVLTAEEARKTREQIAADALAGRRETASLRASDRAAAAKLDPMMGQRIKFIDDRLTATDSEIKKLSEPPFNEMPKNKIKLAALMEDRKKLEKVWGDLLGFTLPAIGESGAGNASKGWEIKPK